MDRSTISRRDQAQDDLLRHIGKVRVWDTSATREVPVAVRWDFSGGGSGGTDQSEGEICKADESRTGKTIWIDGISSLMAIRPAGFGDSAVYVARRVGTKTISGSTRPLYVVTGVHAPAGSSVPSLGTAAAVVEVTATNCAKVLDASEASIQTTIAGTPGDNILYLNNLYYTQQTSSTVATPPVGTRLDWLFAHWSFGYQVLPDFQAGAGRGGTSAGLRIDYGEPFDLILGQIDPSYSNTGPSWFGKLGYSRILLRMRATGISGALSIQTYQAENFSLHFDSVIGNYYLARATGAASIPTMVTGEVHVTVKDKDGVDQACVIAFTFDGHGRLTSVAATSGILTVVALGGRR